MHRPLSLIFSSLFLQRRENIVLAFAAFLYPQELATWSQSVMPWILVRYDFKELSRSMGRPENFTVMFPVLWRMMFTRRLVSGAVRLTPSFFGGMMDTVNKLLVNVWKERLHRCTNAVVYGVEKVQFLGTAELMTRGYLKSIEVDWGWEVDEQKRGRSQGIC